MNSDELRDADGDTLRTLVLPRDFSRLSLGQLHRLKDSAQRAVIVYEIIENDRTLLPDEESRYSAFKDVLEKVYAELDRKEKVYRGRGQ
jgi:hypothetical protein